MGEIVYSCKEQEERGEEDVLVPRLFLQNRRLSRKWLSGTPSNHRDKFHPITQSGNHPNQLPDLVRIPLHILLSFECDSPHGIPDRAGHWPNTAVIAPTPWIQPLATAHTSSTEKQGNSHTVASRRQQTFHCATKTADAIIMARAQLVHSVPPG